MTWSDGIDSDHAQAEMLWVLQLLLAHIKTIAEEVVVCTGHSAETGEDEDRRSTRDRDVSCCTVLLPVLPDGGGG